MIGDGSDLWGATVTVTDGCLVDTAVEVESVEGLTIECASAGCALPPMSLRNSIVTIKDGTFTTDHEPDVSSTYGDLAGSLPISVALYAQGGELKLVGTGATGLTDADGAAVLAIDTSVSVTGGQFVDLAGGRLPPSPGSLSIELAVEGGRVVATPSGHLTLQCAPFDLRHELDFREPVGAGELPRALDLVVRPLPFEVTFKRSARCRIREGELARHVAANILLDVQLNVQFVAIVLTAPLPLSRDIREETATEDGDQEDKHRQPGGLGW